MDQRASAGVARCFGDVPRSIDVDRLHLPAEHADEVDDRAGAIDGTADAFGIGDVRLDETELADLAQRLDELGVARVA